MSLQNYVSTYGQCLRIISIMCLINVLFKIYVHTQKQPNCKWPPMQSKLIFFFWICKVAGKKWLWWYRRLMAKTIRQLCVVLHQYGIVPIISSHILADSDNQSDVYISQIPHEFDKVFILKALVWSISGLHFIKGQSKLSSNLLLILTDIEKCGQ